jgi:hypothetical protein
MQSRALAHVHALFREKPRKEITHMRFQRAVLISLMMFLATITFAQDSKYFRERLGKPFEVYEHKSGVRVEIEYNDDGQVCHINLRNQDESKNLFDSVQAVASELIPVSSRGALRKSIQRAGNCFDEWLEDYERVFVIKHKDLCWRSTVQIYFKRDSCPKPPDMR